VVKILTLQAVMAVAERLLFLIQVQHHYLLVDVSQARSAVFSITYLKHLELSNQFAQLFNKYIQHPELTNSTPLLA
jgi:hypothetical protein